MPKTYIENIENQGGTINVHNSQINLPPHIIPKKLTPQTGLANDIDFVGRKEELQKVDELLNQNSMLLLLNGIGGIGKSTLASYYLNQHKDNFDYYGFVQVNEDIKLSLASAFGTSLDLKSKKIDDLFAEIMNKLHNLEGKKLLIIDDIKKMDSQLDEINTLMTLKNSGFQILFTSREIKEYIPQYFLDIMSVEDARELFLKHYPTDEMDKVDKILKYLDYHTLFIEITAKTLKQRKRTLSLDKMIEKFVNGDFSSIKKNKRESFNLFLSNLFSNDKILKDEETLLFLKRLSILPSIEISFEDLYKFLVCENEEKLEDFLIELIANGWLIELKNGYKFHQILKEYIINKYNYNFNEIEIIIDYYFTLMKNTNNAEVVILNKKYLIYFDSFASYLINYKYNEKIIIYLNNMGNIYYHLDKYNKSLSFYINTLKFYNKTLGAENNKTLESKNNLGRLYWAMGEYKKSLPLLKNILTVRKYILGENHEDTALSYNNLGLLYWAMGEYKKSLPLLKKSLNIRKKILGYNHFQTGTSYNNLGLLYWSTKRYKKSKFVYVQALKIRIKTLGKKHPDTAKSYHNLALLYKSMKFYHKSLIFFKKALKLKEEIVGINYPTTASTYNAIGELYKFIGNNKNALLFLNKALKIRENILGKNHPYTAITYHNLAVFYLDIKEFSKAYKYMKISIKIRNKVLSQNHPHLLSSKEKLDLIKKELKKQKKFNINKSMKK